jgi:ferredoxin-NADP reductase
VLSQASKYIINLGNKHIFNPVAFSVALTALALNQSATWWVGTSSMLVFVFLGGLFVIRKVRRFEAVLAFLAAAFAAMFVLSGSSAFTVLQKGLLESPLLFFAAVMLTEPLTMPPTRDGQMAYGILVGALLAPQTHIGSFYFTPELALLAGNIFSYVISPKTRHVLTLKEKKLAGTDIYDFIFSVDRGFKFRAGQYMEWTLGHKKTDSRGNRRYFTLASSPTEKEVILGVKFYEQPSSFKKQMLAMKSGDKIIAGSLAGDFTLPSNSKEKLVFIAGGIGVTPFRSMLKYLADKNEKREIVLIYSNKQVGEVAYRDVLLEAWQKLGVRIICTLTGQPPEGWQGHTGYVTPQMVMSEVPDYKERTFYISGSHVMVKSFSDMLSNLGVKKTKIKTDFFPGLA